MAAHLTTLNPKVEAGAGIGAFHFLANGIDRKRKLLDIEVLQYLDDHTVHTIDRQTVDPLSHEHKRAYASRLRQKTDLAVEDVERAVDDLLNAVEGYLQEAERHSARGKTSQATMLVEMVVEEARELFHAAKGGSEAYVCVVVDGHHEIYPLQSSGFRFWLSHQFYKRSGKSPGEQAVREAVQTLVGIALHDGAEQKVYTRVAAHDGAIYIDLADDRWRAVRIDPHGWEVVENPPVRFVRRNGMSPLPEPTRGGRVQELRRFLNLPEDPADGSPGEAFVLIVVWLLDAMRPDGPYPVLVFRGEQGSAKSMQGRILRALVDPNMAPLRKEPKNAEDVFIAARNSWCINLDNLSFLHPWLSDLLCVLSTGGARANGSSTRTTRRSSSMCSGPSS